jgi:outer membrane protein insertion porin family
LVPPLAASGALAVLSPAAVASAQPPATPYVDRPVVSIQLTIEGRPAAEPALLEAVQSKRGAPLKMEDVRETITHLYSLGRFSDVQVEADNVPDGVALRFELKPIHTVTRVEFRGQLGLGEGELRSRMVERFGVTPPATRAADVAALLVQFYQERGFLRAAVTAAPPVIAHDPDRATLVFDVEAGPRTMIGQSAIAGRPLEPAAQIQTRLQIRPGQPYEPGTLRQRIGDLVTSMRHRRYYQAAANLEAPAFNADRTQVQLTVDVQPGPLVSLEFTGDPLPKDKIAELVPVEREGSVDEDLLEDSARRIVAYLNQLGYWKAEVKPPERREANGQLSVVFHVDRGRIYRVAPGGLEITGNRAVTADELKPLVRLAPGDLFVASRLGAIEGAIQQIYKARGFARMELATAVNEVGDGLVSPTIAIKEGPRVVVGDVSIAGNQAVPTERLRPVLTLVGGAPYYGPSIAINRDALIAYYLDEGYASADVTVAPVMNADGTRADITFKIVEGPQTVVEHIFITGNLRTNPAVIQRELQIAEGRPLGQAAINESRLRLSGLGLFRRIQISVISHGDPRLRDVVIAVEEAQQTTVSYGGGLQVDRVLRSDTGTTTSERYEFAPRGFFEIGRRNLGGRNRSVNLYSRLSLRPNPDATSTNPFGFSEYRFVGTYREPRALRNYGDLTATAAVEQGVRTGFNFSRKGFNAELGHRIAPTTRGSLRYSFGTTRIFDNRLIEEDDPLVVLTVDRVFPQVRLSSFSAAASRDTRDDPLEPQKGAFLSGDASLAARGIGSEVGFTKAFVQGFLYRNLGRPHLVFAGGARLGLARAFLRFVETVDASGNPQTVAVRDLPASERFFAGGDTTIRGYALDSVGVPDTITPSGFPKGGDAEVVLNAELRFPVVGNVGAVVFVDGGNVFARAADLDVTSLRGSVGLGGRYRSPLGPIRIDIGFKLDRRTVGTGLEPRYAIHFSIGQAF